MIMVGKGAKGIPLCYLFHYQWDMIKKLSASGQVMSVFINKLPITDKEFAIRELLTGSDYFYYI
jgi:hypothetical protein